MLVVLPVGWCFCCWMMFPFPGVPDLGQLVRNHDIFLQPPNSPDRPVKPPKQVDAIQNQSG